MKRTPLLLAALAALLVAAPVQAQDTGSADLEDELRSMVTDATPAEQNRAAVHSFLEREDVASAAEEYGIDLERLEDGVGTLGAEAAANLAERVEQTENQLDQVGGDTFVVSTTAVIIGLLIAILIIVA